MTFEGVNFNEEAMAAMTKEEFVSRHLPWFWKDRDEKTRRSMLEEAYDLKAGKPVRKTKRKS